MVASVREGAIVPETRGSPASRELLAVIFDLDGVLVGSEPWWHASRAAVARRHGAVWSAVDEASIKGANTREWAAAMRERLALPIPDDDVVREVVRTMTDRYATEGPARIETGIAAVARLGRRYQLAVASSAHRDVIDAALRSLGLTDAFRAVVSSDEVGVGKPAPDVYLEAARRLRVPPAACLVIEDSPSGVRAARSAGMRVVWVGSAVTEDGIPGREDASLGATLRLESLDELDDPALDRLSGSATASDGAGG